MEAATRLPFSSLRRRRLEPERELEQLRPLGEAYLMRRFGHAIARADAEDAVAEVVIRLHRRIEDGRAPRNLRAAFFTSVRNAAIDQLRSRAAKPTVALNLVADAPADAPTPVESAEAREDSIRLQEALGRMRPNYREAILLRFGAGLTVPEIAERLQISLPAAKKLVLRSTAQIRKRLAAIEDTKFCPEMRELARRSLFEKEVAGLSSDAERRTLHAHFEHCGSCKSFLADLHRGLNELGGSALLLGAGGSELAPKVGIADHLGGWLGSAGDAAQALAGRARLAAMKASGAFQPGEAATAGALTGTTQKIAAVCGAATATTATCLATGFVGPGIGSSAIDRSAARSEPAPAAVVKDLGEEVPTPTVPTPGSAEPIPAPESDPPAPQQPQPAELPPPESAPEASPSQSTEEEFGFESDATSSAASAPAPAPTPAPAPAPAPAPTPAPPPSSTPAPSGGGGGGEAFGFDG
jgi:RNA polymerase sigma factor (sigma-70 family)